MGGIATSSRYISVCTGSCFRPGTGGGEPALATKLFVANAWARFLAKFLLLASACLAAIDRSPSI